MDNVILQKDLFLGEKELSSIVNNSKKDSQLFKESIINSFGIVKKESDTNFDALKIVEGTGLDQIKILDGVFFDANNNFIEVTTNNSNYTIPVNENPYTVVLRTATTSFETGLINISSSGQITCVGGSFDKFRVGDYPTRIKFFNSTLGNDSIYEVHSIISETQAQLTGNNFVEESNLTYKIYGTFTQSKIISNPLLYEYNRFEVVFIPLAGTILDTDIVLGEVLYNGSIRTITDGRTPILTLNNVYQKSETYAKTEVYNKSENYTKAETVSEIKKNVLGFELLDNSNYDNGTNTLKITKTGSIFQLNFDNSSNIVMSIGSIIYTDNSVVEVGKTITLQCRFTYSTGAVNFLLNGGGVSNIIYPYNITLSSINIPSSNTISTAYYGSVTLYKASDSWVLMDNSLNKADKNWKTLDVTLGTGWTWEPEMALGEFAPKVSAKLNSLGQIHIYGWVQNTLGTSNTNGLIYLPLLYNSWDARYVNLSVYNSGFENTLFKVKRSDTNIVVYPISGVVNDSMVYFDFILQTI